MMGLGCNMARRKLAREFVKLVKDRLVDEHVEDKMAAIAEREDIAAPRWRHKNYAGRNMRLCTAYGTLEVPGRGSWWTVQRDGEPLVHARSPLSAVFTTLLAAKAAALVHVADGFGNQPPDNDGLWWQIDRPSKPPATLPTLDDFHVDPSQPDDHEWGYRELDRSLKASGMKASSADENLVLDLEAVARSWQLAPPSWIKHSHGRYELKTPYGLAMVRRLVGWTVELNGAPLVWSMGGERVIFDKLEHAKTSALVHARDWGESRFADGTRWDEPTLFVRQAIPDRVVAR
jgi:hypothetical protein